MLTEVLLCLDGPGNPGLPRPAGKIGGGLMNENGEAVRQHRRVPGYDDIWRYRALEREWRYLWHPTGVYPNSTGPSVSQVYYIAESIKIFSGI
jgi:hypothetical protein